MKTVDIKKALELLKAGDVVAIPTETVYGLAAWINSEDGIHKIFSTKERPFFDPLIVHIDSIAKAKTLTSDWTAVHEVLAQECWPGPLTLIAKKNDLTNPLITSGLDSVGLRCPKHEITLKLLSLIEGGLAAPSANKFGKTSPTTASHVFDEFGDKVGILDGGPCDIGIESTVAGVEKIGNEWTVLIYRPGFYTAHFLEKILAKHQIVAKVTYAESPVAPGQLKHHYMPNIPLIIIPETTNWNILKPLIESKLEKSFSNPAFWKLSPDPRIASRELYQSLRDFSANGHDVILIPRKTTQYSDEWKGIWNRLEKAKSLEISDKLKFLD